MGIYLNRNIDSQLIRWISEDGRKPLLVRGARQVGKSSAIRHLAERFEYYVEVNFDKRGDIASLFENNLSPKEICENLSVIYNNPIIAGKTLLFLDEIQQSPEAIKSLRYFYEDYPELHVVAAGSLLEFALEGLSSYGVGRIRSIYVYPFSFEEFLMANGESLLWNAITKASAEKPLVDAVHAKALQLLKKFLVLGGMPEVVAAYVSGIDMVACIRIIDDLIISYRDDFSKYKERVPELRIAEVLDAVVQSAGGQFAYKGAATNANLAQIKEALELLVKSGLVTPVIHTAANGIPLGAEINPKRRKMLPIDTGIFQRILGLNISEILLSEDLDIVNKGAIAEIHVGLELQKSASCYSRETLYFWKREAKSSNAEVDYLVQKNELVIPIEVKSSGSGSMQSMYQFISEKSSEYGIRCSTENYCEYNNVKVIPLYGAGTILNAENE